MEDALGHVTIAGGDLPGDVRGLHVPAVSSLEAPEGRGLCGG